MEVFTLSNIRQFFTEVEWNSMAPIERVRSSKVFQNYKKMTQFGITAQPPDFVRRYEERQRKERAQRQSNSDVRLCQCFSPYGSHKKNKRQCQNNPSCCSLRGTQMECSRNSLQTNFYSTGTFSEKMNKCNIWDPSSKNKMNQKYPSSQVEHQLIDSPDNKDSSIRRYQKCWQMSTDIQRTGSCMSDFSEFSSKDKNEVIIKHSSSIGHSEGKSESVYFGYLSNNKTLPVGMSKNSSSSNDSKGNSEYLSDEKGVSEFSGYSSNCKDVSLVMNTAQPEKGKYTCCVCKHETLTKQAFSEHIKSHTGELLFNCDECGFNFKNKYDLTKHIRRFKSKRRFQCSYCNHSFSLNQQCKRHEKIHFEGQIPCCICGVLMSGIVSVRKHIAQTHLFVKNYQCSVCKEIFTNENHLIRHEKRFIQQHPHHCHSCSHTFPTALGLKRHLASHKNVNLVKCDYCFKVYGNQSDLNRHLKKSWLLRKHTCQGCKSTFMAEADLERYRVTVGQGGQFRCFKCEDSFRYESATKYNEDSSVWKCKSCDKSFTRKIFLKAHMQIHSIKSKAVVEQRKSYIGVQITTMCKHGILCCKSDVQMKYKMSKK